ncbi:hypothetical protein NCC49_001334 [Naganishia albida]|nr:hypothetical protein NCC49_001334 [Naganishia albida]
MREPRFSLCCSGGKIELPPIGTQPPCMILQVLMTHDDPRSADFRDKIQRYNNALAFTSIGMERDLTTLNHRGVYTLRCNGRIYHHIGAFEPADDMPAHHNFAQLYLLDPVTAALERLQRQSVVQGRVIDPLDPHIMNALTNHMHEFNQNARIYRTGRKRFEASPDATALRIRQVQGGQDPRRYNLPLDTTEIAAVVVDGPMPCQDGRDLWVERRDAGNGLHRVSELGRTFMGLHYPLMHPNGEDGWYTGIPLKGANWDPARYPQWVPVRARDNPPDPNNPQVQEDEHEFRKSKTVSALRWIRYRIQMRRGVFNYIHNAGKLAQEYLIDWWCQIEWSRLRCAAQNQLKLRKHNFRDLDVAFENGMDPTEIGIPLELPASFIGGERNMKQLYQDAMCIVRRYGQPSFFITMTCNPEWPEITRELIPNVQRPQDRPDLIARVFNMKLKALIHDITARSFLGNVIARVHTIEFKKRGLPHAHLLLITSGEDRPRTADDIDAVVSAELPDSQFQPELWNIVTKAMLHGHCTKQAQCYQAGSETCAKKFPRPFREETIMQGDGYPLYRRRDNGRTFTKVINGVDKVFDNRHVVPYNPGVSRKFNCHINVEITSGIRAVKYIYKYIFKGEDRAVVQFDAQDLIAQNGGPPAARHPADPPVPPRFPVPPGENQDGGDHGAPRLNPEVPPPVNEVKRYIDARYITAYSACWRIFSFPMHQHEPSIYRLAIHLPDQQNIVYHDNANLDDIVNNEERGRTMLTEFFAYCSANPEDTRDLLSLNAPEHLTWRDDDPEVPKHWAPRAGAHRTIGRMYFISPRAGEIFYVRMLLHVVPSPKSFEHLRTFEGVLHANFQSACRARGLLDDDREWHTCLQEAAVYQVGGQFRHLFAIIICNHPNIDVPQLYSRHFTGLSDDITRLLQRNYGLPDPTAEQIRDTCLILLQKAITFIDPTRDLASFHLPLPSANAPIPLARFNALNDERQRYNQAELQEQVNREAPLIAANAEQLHVVNSVLQAIEANEPRLFFLQGPGGTGKTFVENHILARVRSNGHIALAVASSGIASLLLRGGRTARSRFKIPIDVSERSALAIPKESALANLIRQASLIVWDEVPMQHRNCAEAVDRCLRDLRDDPRPFGGVTVLFGGDWAQTLPVVPNASPGEIVQASLQRSPLWQRVTVLRLKANMRLSRPGMSAQETQHVKDFSQWLLRVGKGLDINREGLIPFPPSMRVLQPAVVQDDEILDEVDRPRPPLQQPLIEHCYGDIRNRRIDIHNPATLEYFSERSILAAKNVDVDHINAKILEQMPGNCRVFESADSIPKQHEERYEGPDIPLELLNSFNFPGMPLHRTALKIGAPIILLRNLDLENGLCNGTRLIVTNMATRLLEAVIITGEFRGNKVFIPRLALDHQDKGLAITMRRLQFPVKLAFALTINKSQGQSLKVVGLDLTSDVFAHGQLYVALSRATTPGNVAVSLQNDRNGQLHKTRNVVYPQIVQA